MAFSYFGVCYIAIWVRSSYVIGVVGWCFRCFGVMVCCNIGGGLLIGRLWLIYYE
jgi:hypothetical protein